MIFIKIRIVCAAFREECPFYGHSALLRSALVAVENALVGVFSVIVQLRRLIVYSTTLYKTLIGRQQTELSTVCYIVAVSPVQGEETTLVSCNF